MLVHGRLRFVRFFVKVGNTTAETYSDALTTLVASVSPQGNCQLQQTLNFFLVK